MSLDNATPRYLLTDPDLGGTPERPKAFTRAWYRAEIDQLFALAARGIIRPREPYEDADNQHTHVCGYDPLDQKRKGCGHVWRHPSPPGGSYATKKELDETHTCPQCGRGNWTTKRLPNDERLIDHEPDAKGRDARRY